MWFTFLVPPGPFIYVNHLYSTSIAPGPAPCLSGRRGRCNFFLGKLTPQLHVVVVGVGRGVAVPRLAVWALPQYTLCTGWAAAHVEKKITWLAYTALSVQHTTARFLSLNGRSRLNLCVVLLMPCAPPSLTACPKEYRGTVGNSFIHVLAAKAVSK